MLALVNFLGQNRHVADIKLTSGKVSVPEEGGAVEPGQHPAHRGHVEKTQQH